MKMFLSKPALATYSATMILSLVCLNGVAQQPRPSGLSRAPGFDANDHAVASFSDKIAALVSAYRENSDEKERSRLTDELTSAVTEEFDTRQKTREAELSQLEEQVRKLREVQKRRESEKTQIVADRVRQLVREADGLGWGGNSVESNGGYAFPSNRVVPGRAGSPPTVYQTK